MSVITNGPLQSTATGRRPDTVDPAARPVTLSVLAYGVTVSVQLNDSRFAEELRRHLPPQSMILPFCDTGRLYSMIVEPDGLLHEPRGSLYVNGAAVARRVSIQTLMRVFEANLQIHVAEMAPDRVFIHAGVVGWRGRAILLPGPSYCGKTTLATAMVRAGAEYYSDEYAVIDAAGAVHPYARRPSVREPGESGAVKRIDHAIGGRADAGPLPVGLVVVTQFRSDAVWRPRPLSPGLGALALLANTVPARRIPQTVLSTLQRVLTVAQVVTSDRADVSTVVEPILALAARQPLD